MDILLATMQLGPGYGHGTERYVSGLARGLRAGGHRVRILAGDPLHRQPAARLGAPRGDDRDRLACPTGSWMAVLGRSPRGMRRWLGKRAPDLVHVASPAHVGAGVVASALELHIPVVATAVDFWWVCPRTTLLRDGREPCDARPGWRECLRCVGADAPRSGLRALTRRTGSVGLPIRVLAAVARGAEAKDVARWPRRRSLLTGLLRACDQVIFPSAATRDVLRPLLDHDRWHTIPYGIDRSWTQGAPRERAAGPLRPEELRIGYASSLRPHKGLHLLLQAVEKLGWTRTRIRVAGSLDDPAFWSRLRRRFASLWIDHAGRLAEAEMADFLRDVDVLVVPSLWAENLPFVLLEAQACATPVIASDVAGMAERIPLAERRFERGSADDLARALSAFLAAPHEDVAPRVHTLEEMVVATERVYRRALAS